MTLQMYVEFYEEPFVTGEEIFPSASKFGASTDEHNKNNTNDTSIESRNRLSGTSEWPFLGPLNDNPFRISDDTTLDYFWFISGATSAPTL